MIAAPNRLFNCRWDKMGSSALNQKPDEVEEKNKGYVPQYNLTGQGMHYRMPISEGG